MPALVQLIFDQTTRLVTFILKVHKQMLVTFILKVHKQMLVTFRRKFKLLFSRIWLIRITVHRTLAKQTI
jgi:hypothetical protein